MVQREWFKWLCHKIDATGYTRLINELYSQEFLYTLPMDKNRVAHVITMQEDFAEERGYSNPEDNHFISVFEVLAVMAITVEDEIMSNPEYGDRTSMWFWDMMRNLELDVFDDNMWNRFDPYTIQRDIDEILIKFMSRDYNEDGSDGGAIILENPKDDLREVDLWYQLMWWCYENHPEETEF